MECNFLTKDLATAARWFAGNGFPVLPCKPRDKAPLTAHGFKDASTDIAQVAQWWKKWPDANVGIKTGAVPGREYSLLVVDCDPRNGGPETREDLVELLGPYPETAEVVTGSGGRHVYFKYPGGALPKELCRGVDLKGEGGYVIAPPSIHPNNNAYDVDGTEGTEAFLHLAEAPQGLLDKIKAPRATAPASAPPAASYREGGRNNALASLAGSMRRRGMSEAAILAALLEENNTRCDPPLDPEEVRRIASSIARYPAGGIIRVSMSLESVTLDTLNAIPLFTSAGVTWRAVCKRGSSTLAEIETPFGVRSVCFRTETDLLQFPRARAVLSEAGALIDLPPKGDQARVWGPVVKILCTLRERDRIDTEDGQKAEWRDFLIHAFHQSGRCKAKDTAEMVLLMKQLDGAPRVSGGIYRTHPCVFIAEEKLWVHPFALKTFLSLPSGFNRTYTAKEIQDGLSALDFRPKRDTHRQAGELRAKLNLWCGPILEDLQTDTSDEQV